MISHLFALYQDFSKSNQQYPLLRPISSKVWQKRVDILNVDWMTVQSCEAKRGRIEISNRAQEGRDGMVCQKVIWKSNCD